MVKQIAITLIILSITLLADKNETSSDSTSFKEIMKIAKTTLSKHSEEELKSLLKDALWSEDKGEVVVSFPNKKRTTLYLFMKNLKGKYIAVNISSIELINLGRIGLKPQYKKLESKAIEWIEDTEELVMVKIE